MRTARHLKGSSRIQDGRHGTTSPVFTDERVKVPSALHPRETMHTDILEEGSQADRGANNLTGRTVALGTHRGISLKENYSLSSHNGNGKGGSGENVWQPNISLLSLLGCCSPSAVVG